MSAFLWFVVASNLVVVLCAAFNVVEATERLKRITGSTAIIYHGAIAVWALFLVLA